MTTETIQETKPFSEQDFLTNRINNLIDLKLVPTNIFLTIDSIVDKSIKNPASDGYGQIIMDGIIIHKTVLQSIEPLAIEIWNKYGQERLSLPPQDKFLAGLFLASIGQAQKTLGIDKKNVEERFGEVKKLNLIVSKYHALQEKYDRKPEEIAVMETNIVKALSLPE